MPRPGPSGTGDDALNPDPYGPADFATGVHNRTKPPPPAPGPVKQPSAAPYTPSGGGGAGATYDLTGSTAGAIAEAEQEATDFGGWVGWPSWYDYNAQVKSILSMGVNGDTSQAYELLWTQLGADKQQANINAYFGLTRQQYTEKMNNLQNMYQLYTGDTAIPDVLRNQALKENWTQTELQVALEKDPTIGATAPWIAAGQTFRDVAAQFTSQYGTPQQSKAQLASWWQFRSGAQSVGAGGPAQEVAAPPAPLTSRSLTADVATR